jgi:hypothetical protein
MKINNFIFDFFPRKFSHKILYYKKIFTSQVIKQELKNLKSLKNVRRSNKCFIVGTGPSLKDVSLCSLKKHDIFLTGESYLHPDVDKLNNLYYFSGTNHPPFGIDYINNLHERLERLPSNTRYIFSHTGYKYSFCNYFFGKRAFLSNREKYMINYTGAVDLDKYSGYDSKVYDISKNPFNPRTVIFTALQTAIFMGYKNIYLIGCEHDYILRFFNSDFANHHFYSDDKSNSSDVGEYLQEFSLYEWFEEYYKRWEAYIHINEHCKSRSISIINCTPHSVLDVFPKVDLKDALVNEQL